MFDLNPRLVKKLNLQAKTLPRPELACKEVFCDLTHQDFSSDFADAKKEVISLSVIDYLLQQIELQNHTLPLIRFKLGHHSLAKVVPEFQNLVNQKITANQVLIKKNLSQTLLLTMSGFLALLLGFTLGAIWQLPVINEIIYIVGWVFIWDASELYFMDRHELTHERFKLLQLYFAEFEQA